MRRLHLVRHAPVTVAFGTPAAEWCLAPSAAATVGALARRLRNLGLRRVVTSLEPKAAGTGRILADGLGLVAEGRDGLEEHHRLVAQQQPDRATFVAEIRRFFAEPAAVVFGTESADATLARFRSAVQAVMAESAGDELIVTHGTVMTLLIAAGGNGAAMDIWSSLALPDHVVLEWPRLRRLDP